MIERIFAKAIRDTARKGIPVMVTEGVVTAVDKAARTCNVNRTNLPDLPAVRLNACLTPGNDLVTIYPKVGSKILCILVDNQPADAFMLSATNIEEISVNIATMNALINKDSISFNGGENGGMVKANELKTQIDKNTDIINAIMQILSGAPITELGNGSPSALQIALKAAVSGKQTADLSNIQNTKLKH